MDEKEFKKEIREAYNEGSRAKTYIAAAVVVVAMILILAGTQTSVTDSSIAGLDEKDIGESMQSNIDRVDSIREGFSSFMRNDTHE